MKVQNSDNNIFNNSDAILMPYGVKKEDLKFVDGLFKGTMIVKPRHAKAWLEYMIKNRAVNSSNLRRLVAQINADKWKYNGETFKFSVEGKMIDAQHRCLAIVETGRSLKTDIVIGLEEDAFDTIDTGRNRNSSDVLSALGYKNYTALSSVAVFIMHYETGNTVGAIRARKKDLFNSDVVEFVEKNSPSLPNFVNTYFNKFQTSDKVVNFKLIGGLMWYFLDRHFKEAYTFFDKLMNGVNVTRDEPVFILRKKLLQDKSSEYKMSDRQKAIFIVKTWNATRKGETLKILKWNPANETMPEII